MEESKNDKQEIDKFQLILDKLELIEVLLRRQNADNSDERKEEGLLDNQDMCRMLRVHPRTLQRYRQFGVVTYYMMRGKPYYKLSEVKENLKKILKYNNINKVKPE